MRIKEAKKILGHMISWFFYHQGINKEQPEPMDYSLLDMINANEKVRKSNSRKEGKLGKKTYHMTMDDRLIAALYTAMNYRGDRDSIDTIACANGNYLMVLHETHSALTEEEVPA